MKIQLRYIHPYSFEHTFRRLHYFEKASYIYRNESFIRTIRGEKGPLLLIISHNTKQSCIDICIQGEYTDQEVVPLRARLARMFSTEVDLAPFYEQFQENSYLQDVIQQRKGMHLILEPTIYECLMKTIISQQLNISFAATLLKRFINFAGSQKEISGDKVAVFPTPDVVAGLRYEDLQELQFSRRKAEYVIDISNKVAHGHLHLESLYEKSNDEIFDMLLPLRGVGKWTVECLLLFGVGRPNLLPAADVGLRNALQKVYHLSAKPSEELTREIGKTWSPYASYVTFYLWDTNAYPGKNG